MRKGWERRSAAPRGIGFAFLLVLAAWQLSAAAHQFAHEASVAETCTMCVQLEQNESAAVAATPAEALPTTPINTALPSQVSCAVHCLAGYSSRAPPLSDD